MLFLLSLVSSWHLLPAAAFESHLLTHAHHGSQLARDQEANLQHLSKNNTMIATMERADLLGRRKDDLLAFNYWIADHKILLIVIGMVLVGPVLPANFKWSLSGQPPDPFILCKEAVPTWPRWVYDAVHFSAILGMDLMMLGGIQYSWDTTLLCVRIFIFVYFFFFGFACFLYTVLSKNSAVGAAQNKLEEEPLVADNRYQNFGTSSLKVSVVLIGTMIFMSYYMDHLTAEVKISEHPRAYLYFFAGIPMQILAEGMLGPPFTSETHFWYRMLNAEKGSRVQVGSGRTAQIVDLDFRECLLRAMMAYWANLVCCSTLVFTLPLFLMCSDANIDFVKDCFAIVFIATLDMLNDSIDHKLLSPGTPQEA